MKRAIQYLLFGLILSVCIVFGPAAVAQEPEENQKLKSMISELEQKIDDADKRMIAHPNFLLDLRNLVEKYKSQLRELFFRDQFLDGNYDKNPKWTVKSGGFSVNNAGRLSSFVGTQASPTKTEGQSNNKTLEQEAVGILLDSIFGPAKKQEPAQSTNPPSQAPVKPASIYAAVVFPPAFEMNMKFKSSFEGETDIILLGAQNLIPRYRLKIIAQHSEANPMEIIRESGNRSFTVGASHKFPVINDGKFHTLSWIRFVDGAMKVLIDDIVVLQTYEAYYRDNFTGFEVINRGGSYEWDSFEIYKAQKPPTQ